MKYGMNTVGLTNDFPNNIEKTFDDAKRYGFDVLEILTQAPDTIDIEKVNRAKEKTGLEVTLCGLFGFGTGRDFSSYKIEERDAGLEYIKSMLDFGKNIGASSLCGPFFTPVGKAIAGTIEEYNQQIDYVVDGLAKAAEYADKLDIQFGVESINRYETHLITHTEKLVEVLNRISDYKIKILLDTYHMNIEESDIEAAVVCAGDRLIEFHTCGIGRGTPGDDHFDWNALMLGVKKIGFNGLMCMESFYQGENYINPGPKLWRRVGKSNEYVASQGLSFIKSLK